MVDFSLGSCRSTIELRPQNLSFLALLPAICLLTIAQENARVNSRAHCRRSGGRRQLSSYSALPARLSSLRACRPQYCQSPVLRCGLRVTYSLCATAFSERPNPLLRDSARRAARGSMRGRPLSPMQMHGPPYFRSLSKFRKRKNRARKNIAGKSARWPVGRLRHRSCC
jgi:hypothetical protein